MNITLKEFLRRAGYIPIRDLWSAIYASTAFFLALCMFYGVIFVGGNWIGNATVKAIGMPEKTLSYLIVAVGLPLVLIWIIKERKAFFSGLENFFGDLKNQPAWALTFEMAALLCIVASFKWLPFWAGLFVFAGFAQVGMVIEKVYELGMKYSIPNLEVLIANATSEEAAPDRPLPRWVLKRMLTEFMEIAHEHVPPSYNWEQQVIDMRNQIVTVIHEARDWHASATGVGG